MKQPHQYAYAQARIQAAYARLPGPVFWQGQAGVESSTALMQKIQGAGLSAWLGELPAAASAAAIEEQVRRQMRLQIRRAARWAPPAWQPALRGLAILPDLPALDACWRGRLPPEMLPADLKERLASPGAGRPRLEQLQARLKENPEQPLRCIWLDEWRPLWAALPGNPGVADLIARVEQHLEQFKQAPASEAWPARDRLWAAMAHTLHLRAFEPAALFAYLLLIALALERLRAARLERLLFPSRTAPA